jgi:hypothetical protein
VTRSYAENLGELERRLGVKFPADYQRFLEDENGVEELFGGAYLVLYSLEELPALCDWVAGSIPGLVVIGSDGGGEGVALDFRQSPPQVVIVPLIGGSPEDVLIQASNFSQFMAQRRAGEPLRFTA